MVNNRRSELDIISDILHLAEDGAKKTEILYQGNFSYNQLQSYLYFLIEKNLIEETELKSNGNRGKIYKNTMKGKNLLLDINKTLSYFK